MRSMKKRMFLLPVLVMMFTMMLGTVVWAEEISGISFQNKGVSLNAYGNDTVEALCGRGMIIYSSLGTRIEVPSYGSNFNIYEVGGGTLPLSRLDEFGINKEYKMRLVLSPSSGDYFADDIEWASSDDLIFRDGYKDDDDGTYHVDVYFTITSNVEVINKVNVNVPASAGMTVGAFWNALGVTGIDTNNGSHNIKFNSTRWIKHNDVALNPNDELIEGEEYLCQCSAYEYTSSSYVRFLPVDELTINVIGADLEGSASVNRPYMYLTFKFTAQAGDDPDPDPKPTPEPSKKKEKKEEKEEGLSYLEYLAMLAANEADKEEAVEKELRAANAAVDKDTFKSEAPAKTIMSTDTMGADKFLDLKIHAADDTTKTNQNFLAQALVGTNVKILLTENVYSRRDLSIAENGSLQTLTWNNLPKNQAGPVYAVVYNQIDGAYEINGILDANGTATFTGFKLRPASTITICK